MLSGKGDRRIFADKNASVLFSFLCCVSLFGQAPGSIQTIAGTGSASFSGDGGLATSAALNIAVDVSADRAGNLFIADQFNHRIRKIAPNGIISTVAGTGVLGYSGDGGPVVNALTIDIGGLQADGFGDAQPRGVASRQNRPMFSGSGGPANSKDAVFGRVISARKKTGLIACHGIS